MTRSELHLGMATFAVVLLLTAMLRVFAPAPLPDLEEVAETPVEETVEVAEATTPMTFIRKALRRKEAALPPVVVRQRVVAKYRKRRKASSWAGRVKMQNRIRTEDYRTIYPEGVNADFGRRR